MRTYGWLAALALGLAGAASASAQTAYTGPGSLQRSGATTAPTLSKSEINWTTKLMNYLPFTHGVSNKRTVGTSSVVVPDPSDATEYLKAFGYRQVGTVSTRRR